MTARSTALVEQEAQIAGLRRQLAVSTKDNQDCAKREAALQEQLSAAKVCARLRCYCVTRSRSRQLLRLSATTQPRRRRCASYRAIV